MDVRSHQNMTMLCDFYELTMGNGYLRAGYGDRITYFDLFFRQVPDGGGFAIAAGLEQVVDYIKDLHFDEEDIAYLRGRGIFCEEFLDYLKNFKFTGDIWAVLNKRIPFSSEHNHRDVSEARHSICGFQHIVEFTTFMVVG